MSVLGRAARDPGGTAESVLLHQGSEVGQGAYVPLRLVATASDEAPFINASVITIDGGRSALYRD
jgi:hypothetical protein